MDNIKTNITTKMLQQFASELMFNLSEEQCEKLLLEFKTIEKQVAIMSTINTNGIEPLNYPLAITNTYLRNDNVGTPLTKSSILNIAPEVANDYIIVKQVINHED